MENGHSWMNGAEAAKALRKSVATVRQLAGSGELKRKGKGRASRYWVSTAPIPEVKPTMQQAKAELEAVFEAAWKLGQAGFSWQQAKAMTLAFALLKPAAQ